MVVFGVFLMSLEFTLCLGRVLFSTIVLYDSADHQIDVPAVPSSAFDSEHNFSKLMAFEFKHVEMQTQPTITINYYVITF